MGVAIHVVAGYVAYQLNATQGIKGDEAVRVREVTIKEVAGGWLNALTGRTHKTAVDALRAVKRDARKIAEGGTSTATIITWEPSTDAGSMVVQALQ